jgi:hexosaminidase
MTFANYGLVSLLGWVLLLNFALFANSKSNNSNNEIPSLWPWPKNITYSSKRISFTSPCDLLISFNFSNPHSFYDEIVRDYRSKIFPEGDCDSSPQGKSFQLKSRMLKLLDEGLYREARHTKSSEKIKLEVNIKNPEIDLIMSSHIPDLNESYSISISGEEGAHRLLLDADNYIGFLRGLETFSQLIKQSGSSKEKSSHYFYITNTPVTINDQPTFPHRGMMLDTSRHFINKETIKRNIRAMAYNKMNVFHWHMTDSESFPMYMTEAPNINKYGAFDFESIYSQDDIKEIYAFSKLYGVEIIPEFDNPGHSRAWGIAPEFAKAMVCVNETIGSWADNGQLNPAEPLTYNLVEKVLNQAYRYFNNSHIHLGGDEVVRSCYDNIKVTVEEYMGKVRNYTEGRKVIYWHDTPFYKDNDILQFWGSQESFPELLNKNLKLIYSGNSELYFDCGWSNLFGDGYTWCQGPKTLSQIYRLNLENYCSGGSNCEKILGAEAVLFGEMATDGNIDWKMWPRASALAERIWTGNSNLNNGTLDDQTILRLAAHTDRLKQRGIKASAVWREFCRNHPGSCLPGIAARV